MSTKTKSRTPKKVLPKPVLVPVSKSINQQRPHFAIGLAIMMLSLLVVGTIVVQRYIRDHGLTHAATNAAAPVINKVSLSSAKSNLVIGDTVTLTIETHGAGYLPESVLVNGKTVTGFRRNQAKGLAVTNGNSGYVAILPGNGDGTFATNTYYNTGTTPSSVAFGDLNNDGLADLAVTNASSSTVSILINQGDDTFLTSNLPSYITGKSPYSVAIGDLNNDGHPDLAVANYLDNTVSVLINQGDGTFAAKND